ncbi:hypothetical protein KP509_34G022200 [Ceratopteris richardii]|uniref:Uncharacterized protein n=1 Tax=Ceratopteris richardii TaxID=49495 RepID=A0A8T2QI02_CERRI|nr:hypothetical protein KP509_34G022200 [Ceratopteris richardii]KAH7283746.1 hypothetical protein KP509_34G022200 [Ceratopteris richardii]KAH7283747.1 hypothetical protein KP509_34G022200 [Ceratopteris richardii]KAH7283748.1 hypothetical protein KP509_34G022200 [Ceratopteris richardii]
MPSTSKRGQRKLRDLPASQSTRSLITISRTVHVSQAFSDNMQPHEDHHTMSVDAHVHHKVIVSPDAKDEEAAAVVLQNMNLMQQPDLPPNHDRDIHASAEEEMEVEHDNRHLVSGRINNEGEDDNGNFYERRPIAPGRDSESSSSSATYSSGNSDLTAEPIVGSTADDGNGVDGHKSSDSGTSSTPSIRAPKNAMACEACINSSMSLAAVQICSQNLQSRNDKMSTVHDGVALSSSKISTMAGLVVPCRTTTPNGNHAAHLIPSPDYEDICVYGGEQRSHSACRGSSIKAKKCNMSKSSWLELSLGLNSNELEMAVAGKGMGATAGSDLKNNVEIYTASMEANPTEDGARSPVTLQLLPERQKDDLTAMSCHVLEPTLALPPCTFAQQESAADISRGMNYSSSSPSLVPSTVNHAAAQAMGMNLYSHNGAAQLPGMCGEGCATRSNPSSSSQSASAEYASSYANHTKQQIHQISNLGRIDPADLQLIHEGRRISTCADNHVSCTDDQKGSAYLSDKEALYEMSVQTVTSTSTVNMVGASRMVEPYQIYRPIISTGSWPLSIAGAGVPTLDVPSNNIEGSSHWRTCSLYTSGPQQPSHAGGISWQGLLGSVANESVGLYHSIRPLNTAAPGSYMHYSEGKRSSSVNTPERRHGHFVLDTTPSSRPGSSNPTLLTPQRLRLVSSRSSIGRKTGIWFSLQEADLDCPSDEVDDVQQRIPHPSPSQKLYLRIRDGEMRISVVKSYLMKKLGPLDSTNGNGDEVQITCRGQILSPTLTIQQVHDKIWLRDEDPKIERIGFQCKRKNQVRILQNRVMALCYQRSHTKNVTLNLLPF